jgi:uncharacterized repeat protein (TIGR03803 family)
MKKNFAQCSGAVETMIRWAIAFLVVGVLMFTMPQAQAQTFTVLHNFTGAEGDSPLAGLTLDRAGNLYGTTYVGGKGFSYCNLGCGSVFKLTHTNAGWIYSTLYMFNGPEGGNPRARVVFGPDGALYGTAVYGGQAVHGVVFRLQPPSSFCHSVQCPWTESVIYAFSGVNDGAYPGMGDLVFDHAGNIYGTTTDGGPNFAGTVFQLSNVNGVWTESVLYSFGAAGDGYSPVGTLALDNDGNLYGTTQYGGPHQGGTVFQLTRSGSVWTETTLHGFDGTTDGGAPNGGVTIDSAGNLYGTTSFGPQGTAGIVYQMTRSGGGRDFHTLSTLNGYVGSYATVTLGGDGALYGTVNFGDVDVFKLTQSGGQWSQTGMSGRTGDIPYGNVVIGPNGHLYATGSQGGTNNGGVVLEITP